MSSTNKTTYYELSQYVGTDKPTYLGDYNADMLAIDTGLHEASTDASTALSTANSAASTASDAATSAATAVTTANSALSTASTAQTTAETASTNASAALTAASAAETAAEANTITNLAPAYDATLTYDVGDLVTYIDGNGSGKLYKCIVAVATPMAFNINYWDDVTTSNVFNKIPQLVATVTSDGVMTWNELFHQFYAYLQGYTSEQLINSYIIGNDSTIKRYERILNNAYVFDRTEAQNNVSGLYYQSVAIDDTDAYCISCIISATGVTINDFTENVPIANRVYKLYI